MGAIIVCEFEILEEGIKLKSLQNGATKALQDMVNETFSLNALIGVFNFSHIFIYGNVVFKTKIPFNKFSEITSRRG